jgi:hypothetical protein
MFAITLAVLAELLLSTMALLRLQLQKFPVSDQRTIQNAAQFTY